MSFSVIISRILLCLIRFVWIHFSAPSMLSIRRMAGKFGSHLGHPKIIEEEPSTSDYEEQLPPTPISSSYSSSSQSDYRRSISTTRTSISGWSGKWEGSLERVEEGPKLLAQRVVKRSTGSYRLSDFIVQRTLGTGSFGRVHLGTSLVLSASAL